MLVRRAELLAVRIDRAALDGRALDELAARLLELRLLVRIEEEVVVGVLLVKAGDRLDPGLGEGGVNVLRLEAELVELVRN